MPELWWSHDYGIVTRTQDAGEEVWVRYESHRISLRHDGFPNELPADAVRLVPADGKTITVPRPHVPYGPAGMDTDTADADFLRDAADRLADFYRPFGSNLRATVVQLLRDAADAIEAPTGGVS
ncbi:hypothetical protein ORV05_04815 [Amycolatopsis cynarae]|uniref:DUF402 domain-containing protein n=1 Tax=Amycolatopsis cynarae TaxID=2995223 RepID=A0ABY7B633_9PSEU|nr:hypothetical protein [Amycolatopsis sp. HUAS 11-8]WAL67113.1 hypothetical protein ORV05_04815 [Amycolatopsis sp. HUAS 11-8]